MSTVIFDDFSTSCFFFLSFPPRRIASALKIGINFVVAGVQFIKDCPKEPFIPVYMLIGGVLGTVRMVWALYSQIRSRRPEVLSVPSTTTYASPMKLLSVALSFFLVVWFILGKQEISHSKLHVKMRSPTDPDSCRTFRALKRQKDYFNESRITKTYALRGNKFVSRFCVIIFNAQTRPCE